MKIKITIAEDHELLRKAMKSLILANGNFEIIDEAINGKELIEKLNNQIPDLILLDYRMPIMDGKEALIEIRKKHPNIKILILSLYDEATVILDFITNGANGFISKSSSAENFFTAINTVVKERRYFDSKISEILLNGLMQKNSKSKLPSKTSLSERETSVLKEICNGLGNKLISEKLFISASTVDFHKGNIYKKTKTKNAVDLVMYAIKNGIVPVNLNQ
ncbi:MAG: response regulator transcription factor [Bacteroidota bacterium]|nr:response regulator transcription factor [Bacteroidota bacterium]MDP3146058.1 response regulator transcription factor [Bacteroidota bacterium]